MAVRDVPAYGREGKRRLRKGRKGKAESSQRRPEWTAETLRGTLFPIAFLCGLVLAFPLRPLGKRLLTATSSISPNMTTQRRSILAHASAFLGLSAVVGGICFHFPELLTSKEFRNVYSEDFARRLMLVGLVLAFEMGTVAIRFAPRVRGRRTAVHHAGQSRPARARATARPSQRQDRAADAGWNGSRRQSLRRRADRFEARPGASSAARAQRVNIPGTPGFGWVGRVLPSVGRAWLASC